MPKNTVLIIGGNGSIGRRYQAILKELGVAFDVADSGFDTNMDGRLMQEKFTHWLITSPTDTHIDYVKRGIRAGKQVLCEKPVDKDPEKIRALLGLPGAENVRVVCNYLFCFPPNLKPTEYNYYNYGPDGLSWSCCQLIYLNPGIVLKDTTALWTLLFASIEHSGIFELKYREIELSYYLMLRRWLGLFEKSDEYGADVDLWRLEDGLRMTEAVLEWQKKHS